MVTDRQIGIQNTKMINHEAARLMEKYGRSAALKAMYRAKEPGDFYDLVNYKIIQLEDVA
jgi:hypothetical protein